MPILFGLDMIIVYSKVIWKFSRVWTTLTRKTRALNFELLTRSACQCRCSPKYRGNHFAILFSYILLRCILNSWFAVSVWGRKNQFSMWALGSKIVQKLSWPSFRNGGYLISFFHDKFYHTSSLSSRTCTIACLGRRKALLWVKFQLEYLLNILQSSEAAESSSKLKHTIMPIMISEPQKLALD